MLRWTGLALIGVLTALAGGHAQESLPADPTTRPVWRTLEPTVGTPAVNGEDVFALTANHHLLKLALADGSEQWRVETGERGITYGHAVTVAQGLVLVGEYDVAAFDRVTGRRRWRFAPVDGYAPGPYIGDAGEGVVFAGSAGGYLHAIDEQTGRVRWSVPVAPGSDVTVLRPRIAGEEIVAGFTVHSAPNRGGLVSVSRADGQTRWRFEFPPGRTSTYMAGGPVMADDLVIGSSGDGRIWGLERSTGTLRWSLPPVEGALESIVPAGDQDHRSLALVGRTLVAGSATGYVIGYDIDDPHEVWRFAGGRLGSTGFAFGAIGDLALIPYVSGFLVALDGTTGRLRWRTNDWQQGLIWPPAVAGRLIVAGSRLGLWALRAYAEDER